RSRARVRVHIGTAEILARIFVLNGSGEIAPGGSEFTQLRLETPVAAIPGERFIVRSYSPQTTVAGGIVLDAFPPKHRRKDVENVQTFLGGLEGAGKDHSLKLKLFIESSGKNGCSISDLQARTGWRSEILAEALRKITEDRSVIDAGQIYISPAHFEKLKARAVSEIEHRHANEPLSRGLSKETLKERAFAYIAPEIFKAVLRDLETAEKIYIEHDTIRSTGHKARLSGEEKAALENLRRTYVTAGLDVPKLDDVLTETVRVTGLGRVASKKVFQMLLDSRELVKLNDELYVSRPAVDDLVKKLRIYAAASSGRWIDVTKFKEIAEVSRKYAIPLLEYFDREKVTQRVGDRRVIL
ncbi:MAG: SelB C-terminal domain-containing protein, partial [Pyrinomonadaceae bacterium]